MKSLTTRYTLRTSDVDIRKNYKAFAFMSMAQEMANRHASRIGFGYDDLIRDNISWVVSRMRVKYLEAPKWEDEIQFSTWHKGPKEDSDSGHQLMAAHRHAVPQDAAP